jgi:histidine triad (HIT) family protein
MSLDGTYDGSNVFARILRHELPCAKVYETDTTLAFLDISPQSTGHTLVISKWSQARNILEVEPEALCQVMGTVQHVARALRRVLAPDGLHIAQFNGGDTGQSVFHLHFHIVPRWKNRPLGILQYYEPGAPADAANQQTLAQQIAAACAELRLRSTG